MRSLLLLFICFILSNAHPSKNCELSSDRCIITDFQPHSEDKRCWKEEDDLTTEPWLKDCNYFEVCQKPPLGYEEKFFCNYVIDAGKDEDELEAKNGEVKYNYNFANSGDDTPKFTEGIQVYKDFEWNSVRQIGGGPIQAACDQWKARRLCKPYYFGYVWVILVSCLVAILGAAGLFFLIKKMKNKSNNNKGEKNAPTDVMASDP